MDSLLLALIVVSMIVMVTYVRYPGIATILLPWVMFGMAAALIGFGLYSLALSIGILVFDMAQDPDRVSLIAFCVGGIALVLGLLGLRAAVQVRRRLTDR